MAKPPRRCHPRYCDRRQHAVGAAAAAVHYADVPGWRGAAAALAQARGKARGSHHGMLNSCVDTRAQHACQVSMIAAVLLCIVVDLAICKPPLGAVLRGLVPSLDIDSAFTAVSVLGANIMPHNFYLHRCVFLLCESLPSLSTQCACAFAEGHATTNAVALLLHVCGHCVCADGGHADQHCAADCGGSNLQFDGSVCADAAGWSNHVPQ